ncbi:MAG: hypothetical protein HZB39_09715 [Planctomycetes bacterium]|nr:hypothetical protein [Planctomycetota bacterium]
MSLPRRSLLLGLALISGPLVAQGQATNLAASLRPGQVFLTWTEVAGANLTYRIYRSPTPIVSSAQLAGAELLGSVGQDSSNDVRASQLTGTTVNFRIVDLGPQLASTQGLFVHTFAATGSGHYAVTAVAGATENTAITVGSNALAAPVVENPAVPGAVLQQVSGTRSDYVHWVSDRDTPFAPAMWNTASRAFHFRVLFDSNAGTGPRPLMLRFHARNGSYSQAGTAEPGHPEAIVLAVDDWIGANPGNTFWYGMHAAFPSATTSASHPNVDYTDRRVVAELDFVLANFPVDRERVYARGGSMGAVGAVFFAYRHPDRIAAAHGTVPKFDFGCQGNQCWIEPATGDALWGTPAQNLTTSEGVGVYDRLSIAFLASRAPASLGVVDPLVDRPLITMFNGRNDVVVGWPEKPPAYAAVQAARQPSAFFWDQSTHQSLGSGSWSSVINARRDELWSLRVHQAVPAFTNLSIDDDAGDGTPTSGDPIGTVNGYLAWDVATIVDTATTHSLVASLRTGALPDAAPSPTATVDWTPRRLQAYLRAPSAHHRFTNLQQPGDVVVEDRIVTGEASGLITVAGALVTTAGNRLRLTAVDRSSLPLLLATGIVRPGGTLTLNTFAAPGAAVFLFVGLQPAAITLPGLNGVIGIGDPLFLAQGVADRTGRHAFVWPLDPAIFGSLVGLPIRFQALAGASDLTNTELVTIQP